MAHLDAMAEQQTGRAMPKEIANNLAKVLVEDVTELAAASALINPKDQKALNRLMGEALVHAVRHYGQSAGVPVMADQAKAGPAQPQPGVPQAAQPQPGPAPAGPQQPQGLAKFV